MGWGIAGRRVLDSPVMRRWGIRLAVVLALVVAGLVLKATVFAPEPLPVTAAAVGRGRVEETVTNSRAGTVKARRRAQMSPEVGGRVIAIPHREGERVKAGDVLLELDPSLPAANLDVARRQLEASVAQRDQACAAARRAVRERDRLKHLQAQGIVSTDALDQAETGAETAAATCRAATAEIDHARAAVELARRQGRQYVLRSPFDGVVADVAVEVGEWTTPAPPAVPVPPVIDVIDPASLYVSAPMDEVDSARIHPGQPARVTIDAYPGRHFPGHVTRVAPYVLDRQEQNRTIEIEVELDATPGAPEAPPKLLPGTSADVEVILSAKDDVLRVPTSAIVEGEKVLLVEPGEKRKDTGRLAERKIRIGLKNWDWSEVVSGVSAGDRVVTSLDRPEVKAGAKVKVVAHLEGK
jgi:HlyD family secretion protein